MLKHFHLPESPQLRQHLRALGEALGARVDLDMHSARVHRLVTVDAIVKEGSSAIVHMADAGLGSYTSRAANMIRERGSGSVNGELSPGAETRFQFARAYTRTHGVPQRRKSGLLTAQCHCKLHNVTG